ncbi:MAG: type II toxin-antitoxin system VapC family toxin [Chloroflexi bacterium]|nr:type II toxin-antitoxin system VapC family toxin [Chloroflexota bacterium]
MRYWDTSALVPLMADEDRTEAIESLHASDMAIVTWWGTTVECASALARREREGHAVGRGREMHDLLAATWSEVAPSDGLRRIALRVVRTHMLRGADALQLAAALSAAEERQEALPFVTLDVRLAAAAKKEGFRVIIPVA